MIRTTFAALVTGATALSSGAAFAQDWREQLPTFRVGLLGGENDADRLRDNECLKEDLEELLGIPVELFPAPDYAGVMQGLLADQLDYAQLGASGYAGIYLQDEDAVEPLFTNMQIDGSLGYYSVMYTRADSGITSLEDMEGHSLAFADPNSTSGYLVPLAELTRQGIDLDSYFSATGFGGGHEQAVVAVLNGQYDGGVTWSSGVGDKAEGYSRGNLRSMVDKGMLDMDELNIIWQSNLITNGPNVIRKDLPQELKDMVTGAMLRLPVEDPECFQAIAQGDARGYFPVGVDFYMPIINMRRAMAEESR